MQFFGLICCAGYKAWEVENICWSRSVKSKAKRRIDGIVFSHFLKKRCFQDFELEMLGANEELLGLKKLSERLHFLVY